MCTGEGQSLSLIWSSVRTYSHNHHIIDNAAQLLLIHEGLNDGVDPGAEGHELC